MEEQGSEVTCVKLVADPGSELKSFLVLVKHPNHKTTLPFISADYTSHHHTV